MAQQLDDVLVKARLQIHTLAWESPRGPIKMCAHISRMGPLVMKLPKQSHGASIVSVMHFRSSRISSFSSRAIGSIKPRA